MNTAGVEDADDGQADAHADSLTAETGQKRERERSLVFGGGQFLGATGAVNVAAFEGDGPLHDRDVEDVHVGCDEQAKYQPHYQGRGENASHH